VSDAVVLELNLATLEQSILADGRVGLILIAEMAQRFQDTHVTLASNTFGSMRERVARHVLDLSVPGRHGESSEAAVTQQELADGVGTVREVVARILHDFREEGLVTTTPGHIRILDADRLAAIIEHYMVIGR
jgi:CRP/FNR family transcriptional regulator